MSVPLTGCRASFEGIVADMKAQAARAREDELTKMSDVKEEISFLRFVSHLLIIHFYFCSCNFISCDCEPSSHGFRKQLQEKVDELAVERSREPAFVASSTSRVRSYTRRYPN